MDSSSRTTTSANVHPVAVDLTGPDVCAGRTGRPGLHRFPSGPFRPGVDALAPTCYPPIDWAEPGLGPGMHSAHTSSLGLNGPIPEGVRRPREGIRPDSYPAETLAPMRRPSSTDPMELAIGRIGKIQGASKEAKLGKFQEYAVFPIRCFGSFQTTLGAGCYGSDLEATLRRQSSSHREILMRKGIMAPLTNRIAKACPLVDWTLNMGRSRIRAHWF